jgi:hypothetical protein
MFASLTAGFGMLALALAGVGIYDIMAYSVAQRTNETGVRLALGADRAQIRTMVMGEAGWLAIVWSYGRTRRFSISLSADEIDALWLEVWRPI